MQGAPAQHRLGIPHISRHSRKLPNGLWHRCQICSRYSLGQPLKGLRNRLLGEIATGQHTQVVNERLMQVIVKDVITKFKKLQQTPSAFMMMMYYSLCREHPIMPGSFLACSRVHGELIDMMEHF